MTETALLKLQKPELDDISSFDNPFNPNMDKLETYAVQTNLTLDNINAQQEADTAKFAVVNKQIQDIVKSITDVNNSLATVTGDLQTTNTNLGALTLEVNNIKTQVGTANSDIQALQTTTTQQAKDITTLKNWYEHLQDLSDTQSNQIQTLRNDQTDTAADVADLMTEQAKIVNINNTQNQQIQTHNTLIINNRNQIDNIRSKTETIEDTLDQVNTKADNNSKSIDALDNNYHDLKAQADLTDHDVGIISADFAKLGRTIEVLEYPLMANELTRDSNGRYIASPGASISANVKIVDAILVTTNSNGTSHVYNLWWEYTKSAQNIIIPVFTTESTNLPIWTAPFPEKTVILNVIKQ